MADSQQKDLPSLKNDIKKRVRVDNYSTEEEFLLVYLVKDQYDTLIAQCRDESKIAQQMVESTHLKTEC